ncbi:hypothetical protein ACIBSR_22090 [Streptomyces sp. NPDC049936]|uniref:hypothetical protein n=1 Tax=Streptomyces sp. NPDC049936 TaxID=3365599 RepID=UPI00378D0AF6
MTPWLRTLRATGLVGALGFGALVSPYGVGAAHGVAGFAAVGAALTPSPSGPGHGAVPGAVPDGPDGAGDHDGRGGHARPGQSGGHERPGRPERAERPQRPETGPAAPSAGRTRPEGGRAHGSATPSTTASPSKAGAPARSAAPAASTAEPSRAGSVPGEGRQRPGRAGEWRPEKDRAHENAGRRARGDHEDPATAEPPGEAALVPSASPSRSQPGTGTRAAATGPVLRVLPLGSGLVLIGLGLALAFVGLRLRRG